jgi:hypothetical protein
MILKGDSLDCQRRGSDNTIGDLPLVAPMKTKLFNSVDLEKKRRNSVALLFSVCLTLVVFTAAAAQVKDNKHITAIQLGGAAEGSRVTVVSDSPLIDYKAFRRGDRFYVKISLADFSAATPHFQADGFEDIQVQKVGDSQIVSFKLQPGATARVDQRGNHLDVVFSAANRLPLPNTENPSGDRGRDAAGPIPSDSAASRVRTVNGRDGSIGSGDSRSQAHPKTNSNKAEDNQLTTANVTNASASPSSSSILSPETSTTYQPLSATTPIAQSSSSPASSSGSIGFLNSRTRLAPVRLWMSANGLATLLGALILLSLMVYLLFVVRRRRRDSGAARPIRRLAPAVPLRTPTIVSPAAGHDEQIREEGEREVFEL